jgi:hypothetical protein
MKKNNVHSLLGKMQALFVKLPLLALAAILLLNACQKDQALTKAEVLPKEDIPMKVVVGSSEAAVNSQVLYAGQNIPAGFVVYDDIDTNGDQVDDALQVRFETASEWELTEVHFFIGASLTQLPTTKSGNPQPGQFPYKSGNISGQKNYTITIPFSTIGYRCPSTETADYFVSAHAGLRKSLGGGSYQNESGWGDGLRLVQRGSWAMYNMIFLTCDETKAPPKNATTESAFAFNGQQSGCFINFNEFVDNEKRWGWTNGPYATGAYELPIYAGAGQCDIGKGILVGTLSVVYTGSTATITYTLKGNNPSTGLAYSLKEVQLYIDNEPFPRIGSGSESGAFTIAPGKYPHKAESLSGNTHSFTIKDLSGELYIIAHAVVYGFPTH